MFAMRRAYAGLLVTLLGCNPTAGLADSADAAVPEVKRYFDGRGQLLSDGPWNRVVVDLDVETLYHVGARRLDDKQPTFHLFGSDARQGCEVTPNAGTWLMGKPDAAPFRVLPFLESMDDRGRGRMRFSSLDCTVQDLVVEDAGRPYPRLYDHGYLVPTKHGYTFADPWRGEQREIAEKLQGVLAWDTSVLLWADDKLKSFTDQWEPGSTWGNGVIDALLIDDAYLVEDADGLHRVTFDRDTLAIEAETVLEGACHLQQSTLIPSDSTGVWIGIQQPCESPKPTILHVATDTFEVLDALEVPFEADARYSRALVGGVTDGAAAPLSATYLTDVDDDGRGTLWVWQAGADEAVELGEHGDVDSVYLALGSTTAAGGGQINFQDVGNYGTSDWISFNWDGTTSPFAEHVLRNNSSGEMLVDFDGTAGSLARLGIDGYTVLARGIPPNSSELSSFTGAPQFARVDHFDGDSGRLIMGKAGTELDTWSEIGSAVTPQSVAFSWFMPAVVFLENWDPKASSGSLVAYNYELDARTTIADGVSSFDMTSYPVEGVVYAVPSGKQRGIWFSKAK